MVDSVGSYERLSPFFCSNEPDAVRSDRKLAKRTPPFARPASPVFAEQRPPSAGDDGDGMMGEAVCHMILLGDALLF